ncbi:hypothetical protein NKH48_27630 [Mesorhizobium sp. M1233]
MAKVPPSRGAFAGRWRIVEMDVWDNDVLDIGEEAHLTFEGASAGEIAFVALKGSLDVRYGSRDGAACAEFSWQGYDDGDEACGRGWVMLGTVVRRAHRRPCRRAGRGMETVLIHPFSGLLSADGIGLSSVFASRQQALIVRWRKSPPSPFPV